MSHLTALAARRPRLAWAFALVVSVVVAACKNNGAGSGY
jgi:predicted small secreted protein